MRKRKQETRKRRRVRKNQSRYHTRYTMCRNSRRNRSHRHKSQKLRGGSYAEDVTIDEFDGIPIAEDVVITTAGVPPMNAKSFKNHMEYMDFQGPRQ